VDPSIYKSKGVILQYINNNCTDAASVIGGIRISLDDIRKVPMYLTKYKGAIKQRAANCLQKHLVDNQCITGAGESITVDDFCISYSLASLSPKGFQMNPQGKHEGPLFYCLCAGLIEPIFLGFLEDNTPDYAHLVNVYIHLLPQDKRRTVYLKRIADAKADSGSAAKRSKPDQNAGRRPYYQQQNQQQQLALEHIQENQQTLSTLVKEMQEMKRPPVVNFPPLPEPTALQWPPMDNMIPLPVEL